MNRWTSQTSEPGTEGRRPKRTESGMPLPELLICRDWSDRTADEIAEQTGYSALYVRQEISRLRKQGIAVPYRRKRPGRRRKEQPIP